MEIIREDKNINLRISKFLGIHYQTVLNIASNKPEVHLQYLLGFAEVLNKTDKKVAKELEPYQRYIKTDKEAKKNYLIDLGIKALRKRLDNGEDKNSIYRELNPRGWKSDKF